MNVEKCLLEDISLRKSPNELGVMREYAVLKGKVLSGFNNFKLTQKPYGKRTKSAVFMCFTLKVYKNLLIGETYSFSGFVSLALGNTYLVVEEASDQCGFPVGMGESIGEIEESGIHIYLEDKAA